MTQPLPLPPSQPLHRLHVTDGLLINADRWRKAHHYHRQRQNIHYQSLHQPGVVCGLGVQSIAPPSHLNLSARYQDGRWLMIQPGVAIDAVGNPIIVPEAIEFRVTSQAPADAPLLVYIVVSYVDPEELQQRESKELVQETFRLDEKTDPPDALEIELCRILLQPGATQLSAPIDIFNPAINQLDLRHRMQARSRPQHFIRVAQLAHDDPDPIRSKANLSYLMQSVSALYPSLAADKAIESVSLQSPACFEYDALYVKGQQALQLTEPEFAQLKQYLESGGVLIVDAAAGSVALAKSIVDLAQQIGTPLEYLDQCDRAHPLCTQPFLFAALPTHQHHPVKLLTGGGIVLIVGELSIDWGPDPERSLSRNDMRTAQEFGINILHFAWKRHSLTQLLHNPVSVQASPVQASPAQPPQPQALPAPPLQPAPTSTPKPQTAKPASRKSILDELM